MSQNWRRYCCLENGRASRESSAHLIQLFLDERKRGMPSSLISCPPIGAHTLQRNDETRTLVVDNQVVQFTPTEYRLLIPLLQGQPLSDTELAQAAFSRGFDTLVRKSLDKHIDNIRGKIELLGLSIYRLRRYGDVLSISSN